MYFIECSDFLQHGGRPDGVARHLVAKMSGSWGVKMVAHSGVTVRVPRSESVKRSSCKYGVLFAFAINYHTQQSATSLLLIAVEHLQCKQVIGRRTDVSGEYYQRYARILLRTIRIIAVTTRHKKYYADEGKNGGV